MERGTVTAMSNDGFGFIAPDRHAGEIWVRPRSRDGKTPLEEGQRVEYMLAVGSLGVEAANVRPLDDLRSAQRDLADATTAQRADRERRGDADKRGGDRADHQQQA